MCSRFLQLLEEQRARQRFAIRAVVGQWLKRFNIAPTQQVHCVTNEQDQRIARPMQWGLVPAWAKDPAVGNRMINARSETVADKRSFAEAFRQRRCLVPASGFYEWQKIGDAKTPMYIRRADEQPFAFAGLYEQWDGGETPLQTFTILTTEPNAMMRAIHDRMPVILLDEDEDAWLDTAGTSVDVLHRMLRPYPAKLLAAHPVSRYVNSPGNEGPRCIEPAEPEGLFQ